MLKETAKLIGIITLILIISNTVLFIQSISNNIIEYSFNLTIIAFVIVLWVNVIKLMKSNN